MDYRPLPDDREDEFRAFVTYAFRPESGPHDPNEEIPDPATLGDPYGVFDGDELLSVCRHYWFTTHLRGATHPMAGLSAVATPPENRRRGLVRRMLAESLEAYRERGYYLSALWPFKHPFYAQFEWATSTTFLEHECEPDALSFARDAAPAGTWERLEADDWERLAPILSTHGADYELTLDRTEEWWRKRVFTGWEKDPYVYCWQDESGDDRAYVVYTVESDGEKTLESHDVAWVDHDARLAALGFLADHDSQVSNVKFYGASDSDLVHLAPDPREIETKLHAGPMVRIVDVEDALTALDYQTDESVVLDIEDGLADWNDDTYRITTTDGSGTVEPVDETADATLGIGALTQLVVGERTATDLATTGDIDADADTIDALDALYPETTPFLREGF